MKKILLLHTGGTLGMHNLSPITVQRDSSDLSKDLYARIPELKDIAKITVKVLMNKDSSSMKVSDWHEIGDAIYDNYNKFDGFVVIHGTDTMVYTAAALSFMFKNLRKPIVLTGSQRPLTELRSDAARNLINAIDISTNSNLHEVVIFFDKLLLRGNRAIKVSIDDYSAFDSPNHVPLATVGLDVVYNDKYLIKNKIGKLKFDKSFCSDVLFIKFFPSINLEPFISAIKTGMFKGVVIEAFGAGNLPCDDKSYREFLIWAKKFQIPVVIVSQSVKGVVNLNLYAAGSESQKMNAISGLDMTSESAIVKMMKLIGEKVQYKNFKKEYQKSIAGEILIN